MTWKTGPALTMLVLLVAVRPAAATATLSCDADDAFLSFHVQAAIGYADSFNAVEAQALVKGGEPGAQPVALADEHLVGRWATGRDVRLRFFRAEPAYAIDLTVETRGEEDDESERPGTYRLEFTNSAPGKPPTTVSRSGRASCTLG